MLTIALTADVRWTTDRKTVEIQGASRPSMGRGMRWEKMDLRTDGEVSGQYSQRNGTVVGFYRTVG